ncbi:poly(A) polymerase [Microbotryum lychnidis-dioicae p1A1 Lamole]|uniref:Poly(A) polymerase n=1 Tax=Microbotryum lychnidis-dioicae (strain p1A1 Lamole / MvSl-1064) TaxID=683840 RepID=U5GYD9_USTV1|nr:poly(A) polymerase [Microbotryum lychnidis-dioicae p1A1 Lamole]|eukprot:KDE09808.1 poly(A) polymerase [Microbotryum lychnidis-dioicae p1A1 Lamole]
MAERYLGVTPPISIALPTARDIEVTKTLLQELKDRGQYEGPDEGHLREKVLARLNTLAKEFVYRSSLAHGLPEQKAREAGGKIFTFGSYRLGVHGPGADIDTLLVVPRHVEREEFFSLFEDMLRATEGVVEVSTVPEAYVPIIKCVVSGIEIDFLFARLALATVPNDLQLHDNDLLRNLDERCIRSLGGSRVTDEILRLVPDVAVFREALRTVKLWAKRRAIYSNVMGFCGGVAWAMLVARVCQLYPKGCAGSILSRFFLIIAQWQWPQPILLKPIEDGPLQVRVWNPKLYPSDRSHRMPIITPAYPSMCSTHNVTLSTQHVMTSELKRASDIVDKVFVGTTTWSELFEPHDFFSRYRIYLQITASSGSSDVQLKWSGTVESKVRQLVMKLEFVDTLTLAHPYVKGFDRTYYCINREEQHAVATGEVPPEVDIRPESELNPEEGGTVYTTTFYIGLMIEKKPGSGPRKLDISYPTTEFTKLVKMWDKYDESTMGIIVRYIKASALPAYVHEGNQPNGPDAPKQMSGTKRTKSKPPASAAAPVQPTSGDGNATAAAGDMSDRLIKKLRSSSFVPEGSAPPTGTDTTPIPASTSDDAKALAAATFALEGRETAPATASANGGSNGTPQATIDAKSAFQGSVAETTIGQIPM